MIFQFECCMSGWKKVGSITMCGAPCCPGYRETIEKPPLLPPVTMCKKDPFARDFERLIQLRNDIHSYWQK